MTDRQAIFVREYLLDHNATAAARRAGYSEKTAHAQGHRLLRNAEVAEAVTSAHTEQAARTDVTIDAIAQELAGIAFDRTLHPRERSRALELLGRHRGMFVDKIEHSGAVEFHTLNAIDTALAEMTAALAAIPEVPEPEALG